MKKLKKGSLKKSNKCCKCFALYLPNQINQSVLFAKNVLYFTRFKIHIGVYCFIVWTEMNIYQIQQSPRKIFL